jgi:hypothetical protein
MDGPRHPDADAERAREHHTARGLDDAAEWKVVVGLERRDLVEL